MSVRRDYFDLTQRVDSPLFIANPYELVDRLVLDSSRIPSNDIEAAELVAEWFGPELVFHRPRWCWHGEEIMKFYVTQATSVFIEAFRVALAEVEVQCESREKYEELFKLQRRYRNRTHMHYGHESFDRALRRRCSAA